MKKKVFLVTGAAGFIGACLAVKLINQGHSVVSVDNLSTGSLSNVPKEVLLIKGNCQEKKTIDKLKGYKFDAIFHIAGQSSGEISFENPVYDLQTNAQSTLLLLKLALEINCTKFIYASTMSIYGDQKKIPVNENVVLKPKSFYGVGKISSEHYMRIYQDFGINTTSLRLFNVYGPGQNLKNLKQGMVSIFIAQAIKSKNIHVKGSKDRFRDFIYIDDVVDAFISALNRKDFSFQAINISSGIKSTVEKLISVIKKNIPFSISVEYSGSTPGDQFGITGDGSKAKKLLYWAPKVDLEYGIKRTCKWALSLA